MQDSTETADVKVEDARVMVVTTTHVPAEIGLGDDMDGIAMMTGEYGWLVYSGHEFDEEDAERFAPVKKLLDFAKARGFRYVMFDRDADALDGFETFDW